MTSQARGDRGEHGYSLIELLAVLAILGIFVLISIPNLVSWYETYILRSNARGVASFLKLGRMKAVANNVSYITELNPTIRTQCPKQSGSNPPHVFVIYRTTSGTPKADECFSLDRKVDVKSVAPTPDAKVSFRANGMARSTAPNWFLVKSRNGRRCQLVCVNAAGAVQTNPPLEGTQCDASPYGATASTPCPPPS